MTRKNVENEVRYLGTSYGNKIQFLAVAREGGDLNAFATTLKHLQRAGAKNIQVDVDTTKSNDLFFSADCIARKKTKVCYYITKHANAQKIVIPMWIRSHASFYKRHSAKKKAEAAKPETMTVEEARLRDKIAHLYTQKKRKYNKRKSPASTAAIANALPKAHAPRKVSLFTKFVNWLMK